jgi:hypothetical protein
MGVPIPLSGSYQFFINKLPNYFVPDWEDFPGPDGPDHCKTLMMAALRAAPALWAGLKRKQG